MLHRATRLALVASLFCSMGVHLAVLQTVAWTRMAVTFCRSESFGASLQKTFDGRHPCDLCLKVKKVSQSSSSLAASRTENRLDGISPAAVPQLARSDTFWTLAAVLSLANDRTVLPNSPPPKNILS